MLPSWSSIFTKEELIPIGGIILYVSRYKLKVTRPATSM
jgi:hypothetical protein